MHPDTRLRRITFSAVALTVTDLFTHSNGRDMSPPVSALNTCAHVKLTLWLPLSCAPTGLT